MLDVKAIVGQVRHGQQAELVVRRVARRPQQSDQQRTLVKVAAAPLQQRQCRALLATEIMDVLDPVVDIVENPLGSLGIVWPALARGESIRQGLDFRRYEVCIRASPSTFQGIQRELAPCTG